MARAHPLPTTECNTGRSPAWIFRLGRGEAERLDRLIREKGLTRSELIRQALDRYVEELEESPKAS
jgi:predicted DNA-binding protein